MGVMPAPSYKDEMLVLIKRRQGGDGLDVERLTRSKAVKMCQARPFGYCLTSRVMYGLSGVLMGV